VLVVELYQCAGPHW